MSSAVNAGWSGRGVPDHATPDWRALRRAIRVAREVHRALTGSGVSGEAARVFAFALANADRPTREVGLTLLASRAAHGEQVADGREVERIWNTLRSLAGPTRPPRPPSRTRDRLPVEDARAVPLDRLLASLGFDLRQRGRELVMCCPFHDDNHPSLRVNLSRGLWYCDPCGIGGDGIAFVQRLRGVGFREAVREVAGC